VTDDNGHANLVPLLRSSGQRRPPATATPTPTTTPAATPTPPYTTPTSPPADRDRSDCPVTPTLLGTVSREQVFTEPTQTPLTHAGALDLGFARR
jgi:hypothetical protein